MITSQQAREAIRKAKLAESKGDSISEEEREVFLENLKEMIDRGQIRSVSTQKDEVLVQDHNRKKMWDTGNRTTVIEWRQV